MPIHKPFLRRGHTGKLRAHEHTAYLPLALVLLVVGLFLSTLTTMAWTRPGPEAGSIGISGTMPGKPPTKGATITVPVSGQKFATAPIVVGGTCPTTTLVEIFKNDIFAGSSMCGSDGTFKFEIDPLIGQSTLIARVYDDLNQAGPDSAPVSVTYTPSAASPDAITSLNFGSAQLIINTDAVFRGSFPSKEFTIPVDILGGRAPYAVNIQWGDSTNKVISRPDNNTFQASHAYAKPGTYQIGLQVTDADGRVAFLTVASIVNGQPDPEVAAATTARTTSSMLLALWPLYTAVVVMVVSFWIGEWREKRLLIKHGLLNA